MIVGAPEELRASEVEALRSFARRRGGAVVLLPDKRPTGSYLGLLPAPQFDEVLVDSAVALRAGASSGPALRASELVVPRSLGAAGDVLLAMEQSKSTRPVVVEYPLGAGRVLFSGAMDAWRYRASPDDGFGRFWRTRIAEAALAAPPRLEVSLVPGVPKPGDDVVVNVRIRATEWQESSAGTRMPAVECAPHFDGRARPGQVERDEGVRLWPTTEPGLFQGRITAPKAGRYNLSVSAEGGAAADEILTVVSDARHPRAGCRRGGRSADRRFFDHRRRRCQRQRSRAARAALPRTPELAGRTAGASGALDVLSLRVRGPRERRMGDAPAPRLEMTQETSSSQPIDTYIGYLRDVRRMSPNTVESYARDLTALGGVCRGRKTAVEQLDRRDLEAFVRAPDDSGTVAAFGGAVRGVRPRLLSVPRARAKARREPGR